MISPLQHRTFRRIACLCGAFRHLWLPALWIRLSWRKDSDFLGVERRGHQPFWLLVATGEIPVMKKVHVNVGTIGHIDEWHLVFPQVVGLS